MTTPGLTNYPLYRLRFIASYLLLGLALGCMLVLAMLYAPGGLDASEQQSALTSAAMSLGEPRSFFIVDAPYHFLQKISITSLGLSSVSIKLPSVLLAGLSAIGMLVVCRRWFKPNVSIITTAIVATSAPFLYVAQHGTPMVMHIFWPITILLLASFAKQRTKLTTAALILLAASLGLCLFTPLSGIMLLAIAIGGLLHPYVRYVIHKRIAATTLATVLLVAGLGALPFLYMGVANPSALWTIVLGNPAPLSELAQQASTTALRLGDFTGRSLAANGSLTPVFALGSITLALVGLVRLIKEHHTTQSFITLTWLVLLVPAVLLTSNYVELLLVPFMILIASGVQFVLWYWYRLFPQNPYARAFALLPLAVLLGGIMLVSATRYFYSYTHSPVLNKDISHDLALIDTTLTTYHNQSPALVVAPDERSFYQLYLKLRHDKPLTPPLVTITKANLAQERKSRTIIATRQSPAAQSGQRPSQIIASQQGQQPSDRLYIFRRIEPKQR